MSQCLRCDARMYKHGSEYDHTMHWCRWVFQLNPRLSWDEISKETKQRLRLLPKEAVSRALLSSYGET